MARVSCATEGAGGCVGALCVCAQTMTCVICNVFVLACILPILFIVYVFVIVCEFSVTPDHSERERE